MTAIELRFSSYAHARFLADGRRFASAVHALTVHDRRDRAAALARWGEAWIGELARHRRAEHRVIFPEFAARVGRAAPVVERLALLDERLVDLLASLGPALGRMFSPAVPFGVARAEAESIAVELVDVLSRHVAIEEGELLPLLDRAYPLADYAHLMRCVEALTPSTDDAFTLPWILDGAAPGEVQRVVGSLTRRQRIVLRFRRRRYERMVDVAFRPAVPVVDVLAIREFALAA